MESLLDYFKIVYFTDPLVCLLAVVGLIVLRYSRINDSRLKSFGFLFLSHIILRIYTYVVWSSLFRDSLAYPKLLLTLAILDYIVTVLEYGVFAYYIKPKVNNRTIRIANFCFSACVIAGLVSLIIDSKLHPDGLLYTSQAIAIIILCFSYFLELFNKPPQYMLTREPSFWIICGFAFFMVSTLPYSIILDDLRNLNGDLYDSVFSIFHVFYILLFAMIFKAFLCKPVILK
jgi:hypothetical protein